MPGYSGEDGKPNECWQYFSMAHCNISPLPNATLAINHGGSNAYTAENAQQNSVTVFCGGI